MTKEKRLPVLRIVNPRIFLFAAIIMIAASFCVTKFFSGLDALFYTALAIGIFTLIFGILHLRSLEEILTFLILTVLLLSLSCVGFSVYLKNRTHDVPSEPFSVKCVLDSPVTLKNNTATCIVRVGKNDSIAEGKWALTVVDAEDMYISAVLGCVFELKNCTAKENTATADNIFSDLSDVRDLNVNFADLSVSQTRGGSIFDRLRYSAINTIKEGMDARSAGIASALLFGDRSLLGGDDYAVFRYAGLAHAMAVSGLHIGFLMSVLNMLISKLRRFRAASFVVVSGVCVFYMLVCGGSVSVMRAVIMGLFSFVATLIGKRSDSVNNISIAAMIVLLMNPTSVVSLSFILSFLSVFAILILTKPLEKIFRLIRLPRRVASAFAVTTSATVGILPITASYFHTLNLWTLLSNFIALPLIEVCFVITLIILPIGLLAPVILIIPSFLLQVLYQVAAVFSDLPGSNLILLSFGLLGTIGFFSSILILGSLSLWREKTVKVFSRVTAAALAVLLLIICNMPTRYESLHVGAVGKYSASLIAATDCGVVVVGKAENLAFTDRFLVNNRLRTVDILVLTKYSADNRVEIERFCKRYGVKNLLFDFADDGLFIEMLEIFPKADALLDIEMIYGDFKIFSPLNNASVSIETKDGRLALSDRTLPTGDYYRFVVSDNAVVGNYGALMMPQSTEDDIAMLPQDKLIPLR